MIWCTASRPTIHTFKFIGIAFRLYVLWRNLTWAFAVVFQWDTYAAKQMLWCMIDTHLGLHIDLFYLRVVIPYCITTRNMWMIHVFAYFSMINAVTKSYNIHFDQCIVVSLILICFCTNSSWVYHVFTWFLQFLNLISERYVFFFPFSNWIIWVLHCWLLRF